MEIIGVDHVQFAVRDVVASARYLARHGYELQFEEPDFNLEARSYYRGLRKDLAYLRRGASRVEVITAAGHGGDARHTYIYIPVFDGFESPNHVRALDMGEFRAFWHDELSTACASRRGEAPVLDGVIVRSSRPDQSSAFWQLLGFELIALDDRWYTLAFPRNMLSMPLTLLLARVPSGHEPKAQVDDLGCSSIALITRNLAADRAVLDKERYALSEVTALCINRRPLSICFASGPGGELVELVELRRT